MQIWYCDVWRDSNLPRKSVLNIHWKDWCWSWNSNTLATWFEELTHWKRLWCWERLKVGEGDDRGWDDWMASPTQWTWVWVNSGNWWWTGRPGVLQFMWSQKVRHDWVTELDWSDNKMAIQGKPNVGCVIMMSWHQVLCGGRLWSFSSVLNNQDLILEIH